MIIIQVGNIYCDIIGGNLSSSQWKELERHLSFRPENYQFAPSFNKFIYSKDGKPVRRIWDGWKKQFWKNKTRTYFPTGLFSLVKEYFTQNNISYKVQDVREKPEPNISIQRNENFTNYPYQDAAIQTACNIGRGLISIPTGGGKTIVGAGIISKLQVAPFLFFVTSIDLLTQAKSALESFLLQEGSNLQVGQIGGGIIDIRDINVCTIQTAVRALGGTFKKFDDEDSDDKTPIGQYKDDICEVIRSAKGVICDECISGNSIVITKNGPVKMRDLHNYIGQEILSLSDNNIVWKKITHFYPRGRKKTLKITLLNGDSIICTKDHPIMTKQGWKLAGELSHQDKILCCANVGVISELTFNTEVPANIPNTLSDTKFENDLYQNGEKNSKRLKKMPHCVNVDVAKKSDYTTEHSNYLWNKKARSITNLSMDMIKDQFYGTLNYRHKKDKQYLERYLAIRAYCSQQKEVRIPDLFVITDLCNQNGHYSNLIFLHDYLLNTNYAKIVDMANICLHLELLVIQNLIDCIKLYFLMARKKSQKNGLMKLETLDCHGGYAMTDTVKKIILNYILKGSQKEKLKSSLAGFEISMDQHLSIKQRINTTLYISKNKPEIRLSQKLENTFQNVCNTNYVGIESIIQSEDEEVFDITVEDTHCFFANNILVHNCQHWKSDTCQFVARELKSAYYTFGLSATPFRDAGDDMAIQACFGKFIVNISASQLIRDGYLVKPDIKMIHVKQAPTKFKQWQSIYQEQVVENEKYNNMIANIANAYIQQKRLVLVLIKHINHGKILEGKINGSVFLHGSCPKSQREAGIKNLRNKYISCIIASSIFDEGIDIRALDTVLLAGQGKSKTRALQRIGRILRNFEDENGNKKTKATAIDFCIHQKYLKNHALAREKIYLTEPEFSVEDIHP